MLFRPPCLIYPFNNCSHSLNLGVFLIFALNSRKKKRKKAVIATIARIHCPAYIMYLFSHYTSSHPLFLCINFWSYSSVFRIWYLCCNLINFPSLLFTDYIVILCTLTSNFPTLCFKLFFPLYRYILRNN